MKLSKETARKLIQEGEALYKKDVNSRLMSEIDGIFYITYPPYYYNGNVNLFSINIHALDEKTKEEEEFYFICEFQGKDLTIYREDK